MRSHKIRTFLLLLGILLLIEVATIPFFGVPALKTENPGETALMRQRKRDAEQRGEQFKIVQRWIPLSRIPRHVIDAVVVAEDGTFYSHGGVDWFEVQESIEKNIKERKAARGASTITQQLAKNLYLSTSKDPVRKVKELAITLLLEHDLSKDRILELYLNVIEWGRGIFGIDAAARAYFGKAVGDLTLEDATRLAAVIPSPLVHRPDTDSRYVLRRKAIVLQRMIARGMVTLEEPVVPAPVEDSTESDEGDANGL
jgi:monofunctional glycosyltransferase